MKKGLSIIETMLFVLLIIVILIILALSGTIPFASQNTIDHSIIDNSIKISSPAGSLEINNKIEGNESFVSAENDKFWGFANSLNMQNVIFIIIIAGLFITLIIIWKKELYKKIGKYKKNKRR